jgi:hypothetical protein
MELPSWNLGFEDWDGTKERKPKDTVSEPQFGAMMADYIRTGDLHGSFKDELKHE